MFNWLQKKQQRNKIETLLEVHYPQLYRIAYAWTQDEHKALDLVQETLTKALEKHQQLTKLEQVDRWLTKIMHNLFYDDCRYHKKWQNDEIEAIEHQETACPSVETLYIHHQTIQNIHDAIGALPLKQKEVIVLIDIEGYGYQETAEILEIPIGTVMSRLSRAREKVRKLIHQTERPQQISGEKVIELRRQL